MRKSTLITLLAVAIGQGVFGQTKSRVLTIDTPRLTSFASGSKLFIGSSTSVGSGFVISGIANKTWFSILGKPNWNNPDSLIIYVRKSQLRWINDSTAVIHKSN